MKKIAVFASGEGTNAEWIFKYFENNKNIKVVQLFCNKPDAPVIERAKRREVPVSVFTKADLYENGKVLFELLEHDVDLIVLAGFLWLIPENIINKFPNRIINLHPALLPKYGGQGMYGDKVFAAILKNKERMSGISIHYVNKNFDEGEIIYQAKCRVEAEDDLETLAGKIHRLEYSFYPIIIEKVLMEQNEKK